MDCSLVKSAFFVCCVIKRIVDRAARRYHLSKNASAIVITESEISNQCMLRVFSKSVLLRTNVSLNKGEVIALQVQFACQFGLIDEALHLRPPAAPLQSFLYNFWLDYEW